MNKDYQDDDGENLEFECQLCGRPFPADPSGVVESIDQEELLDKEETWKDEDWEEAETGEVYFICPNCISNLDKYDGGNL